MKRKVRATIPNDLEILDSGAVFLSDGDGLDYLWFKLIEHEGGQTYTIYRIVRLTMLRTVPAETKRDPDLLKKMRQVLFGLYRLNTPVDFLHLAAGIFKPVTQGIVQIYGVSAIATEKEEALESTSLGMKALNAGLAGSYRQIRLEAPDTALTEWLMNAFRGFQYVTSTIGHPDPREMDMSPSGGLDRKPMHKKAGGAILTDQQNEILFRALASAKEEFLWLVMAHPVSQRDLARMLVAISDDASAWESRMQGVRGIAAGLSLPILASFGNSQSFAQGYSQGAGHNSSHTVGDSLSRSQQHGISEGQGGGQTIAVGHSTNVSQGQSYMESDSITRSHITSHGSAVGDATSHSDIWSKAVSQMHSTGRSQTHAESNSASSGGSSSEGGSTTTGHGASYGSNATGGTSQQQGQATLVGDSASASSGPVSGGTSNSESNSKGGGGSAGGGSGMQQNASDSSTDSWASGSSWGRGHTVSDSSSFSEGWAEGTSTAKGGSDGTSHSTALSTTDTEGIATGHTVGRGINFSQGEGWSTMQATSKTWNRTESSAEGLSSGQTRSLGETDSMQSSLTRNIGSGLTNGMSLGLVPSLNLTKSYMWVDLGARQVAEVLHTQMDLLSGMARAGGFFTDVLALTETAEGAALVESATGQAFGGIQETVTTIRARYLQAPEQDYLRRHAACFTPPTMLEEIEGLVETYRHSTLQNMLGLACFTSPASLELGLAQTVAEGVPDFAFIPNMNAKVPGKKATIGHQYSSEVADITDAPFVWSEARHGHSLFQGVTRSGKSVAAERVALECWKVGHRILILDFGSGWKNFFNSEVPRRYFELYQLRPGSARPIRWNPLRVPELISPSRYMELLIQIAGNAGQLGQVQTGVLQTSLREVYLRAGVLVNDTQILKDADWNTLKPAEAAALGLTAGSRLQLLTEADRQRVAVFRSRTCSLSAWVNELEGFLQGKTIGNKTILPAENQRRALESILSRLRPLIQGEAGSMFGGLNEGEEPLQIDALGLPSGKLDRPGFVVIEGGDALSDFAKSFFLSLFALVNYESAKIRYELNNARFDYPTDIIWEEANKVLSGSSAASSSAEGVGSQAQTVEALAAMWRDGARYGIYQWPIVQTVSALPSGIAASCSNMFFFRSTDEKDQGIALTALGYSPKGFTNQPEQRFLSRLPQQQCIVRFSASRDLVDVAPVHIRPLLVPMTPPTDRELREYYGAVTVLQKGNDS